MTLSYPRARIQIDLKALCHNFSVLRQGANQASVLAILKSNAYGHGLTRVAKALKEAEGFGVACVAEAIQLRRAGVTQKIVLLEGCLIAEEYIIAAQYQLDVVIHQAIQLRWLLEAPINTPLTVWLKVNTGMNRLGFPLSAVRSAWAMLQHCPAVQEIILMSHLANADNLEHEATLAQIEQFNQLSQVFLSDQIVLAKSLANSAALLGWPATHYEWVRPGLALYGVSPFPAPYSQMPTLCPVMTIEAKLIAIQNLAPGNRIGYHGRAYCQENTCIGVVAFGYGDGYPYDAPDGTPVLLNNHRVPLIGKVSMDMLTIDLSNQPQAKIGDSVILWGKGLPIEEIAHYTHRSTYELLCGIQRGIHPRVQLDEVS